MSLTTHFKYQSFFSREEHICVNPNKLGTAEDIEKEYRKVCDKYRKINEDFDVFADRVREIDGFIGGSGHNLKMVVRIYDKKEKTIVNYRISKKYESTVLNDICTKDDSDLLPYVNEENKVIRMLVKMRFSGELRKLEYRPDLEKEYTKRYVRTNRLGVLMEMWGAIFTHTIEKSFKKDFGPLRGSALETCVNGRKYRWAVSQDNGVLHAITNDAVLQFFKQG